jgi:hypothetical protein
VEAGAPLLPAEKKLAPKRMVLTHERTGSIMRQPHPSSLRTNSRAARAGRTALLLALALIGPGCAALANPIVDGIPVSQLPDDLRGPSRTVLKPIPLTMLRQKPILEHVVGPNDVLGIVVENVLGERNQQVPIRTGELSGQTPAIGYPILVQDDGTISLPYVPPIDVEGLTLVEVQNRIRKIYTEDYKILKKGSERIIVTLMQPRRFHVLVLREDGGFGGAPTGPTFGSSSPLIGASKKGTGYPLDLPIGENDVLNALTKTGGLPGTDAKNEVIIYKKPTRKKTKPADDKKGDDKKADDKKGDDKKGDDEKSAASKSGGEPGRTIRIPLRLNPGEAPPFKPEDVVLDNGDVVYLESRDVEVFNTGGLLGTGQYPLPRDFDLDVISAIAFVKAPLLNGGFGQAQFVASSVNTGLGIESPSQLTILRKTATGAQLRIRIDINDAVKDPRQRINILPGDFLVLQEKPAESITRYLTQQFRYTFDFMWHSRNFIQTDNLGGP